MLAKAMSCPGQWAAGSVHILVNGCNNTGTCMEFHARMQVSSGKRLLVEMIMTKNAEVTSATPEWR